MPEDKEKDINEVISEATMDSERERVRKKIKKRVVFSVIFMVVLIGVLLYLTIVGIKNLVELTKNETNEEISKTVYEISAEVYDENGRGETISTRVKEYIGQIESDLLDLGYTVSRVVLPQEKAREIDIYLKDRTMYFKVNIDRGTAVSAEDMIRTLKYIEGNGIEGVSYVDVRVEGKAFYK